MLNKISRDLGDTCLLWCQEFRNAAYIARILNGRFETRDLTTDDDDKRNATQCNVHAYP